MSGDIPGVKQLVMLIILVFGHSVNLFMAGLGSFVCTGKCTQYHVITECFVIFFQCTDGGISSNSHTIRTTYARQTQDQSYSDI